MDTALTNAPFDSPLKLVSIEDPELEALLSHLGLYQGHTFTRLDEEVLLHPVRLQGPTGEVVLGGGMAMRIIAHLDDGWRIPLIDMTNGQTGHIEGTTGSRKMMEAMGVLGLNENDPITYLRKLPHMDYTVLVDDGRRERISEGLAAKIWGEVDRRPIQFVSAGRGQLFKVIMIFGGRQVAHALTEKGIAQGAILKLESVSPAQTFAMASHEPVVITTDDGLHLHLRRGQAKNIMVAVKS